uniref:Microtubule-associated protein 1B/S N-terminal domain-containing protein n=1 Tax=Oncorhynchus mykiss TaxID=8022 RepID=A0A8C7TER5_ONCMY
PLTSHTHWSSPQPSLMHCAATGCSCHGDGKGPSLHSSFYMLIVIGEISTDHHLQSAKKHIKQGLRSWDIDLTLCDLNRELQLFATRHSAQFSSELSQFADLKLNLKNESTQPA